MIKQKSILKKAFTLETYDKDQKLNDTELELLKRNMGFDDSGNDLLFDFINSCTIVDIYSVFFYFDY